MNNSTSILKSFRNNNRSEDEWFEDMTHALNWLTSQLKLLKEQDKALMKKFNQIREQINEIKETDLTDGSIFGVTEVVEEEEFEEEEEEEEK